MKTNRRTEVVDHLSEQQLDKAIDEVQKADETRLVRRLCFIKNVTLGDTNEMAARRVGVSQPTGGRWLAAWNKHGVDGLRPCFAGGRPVKLSPEQFEEFFTLLEEGQPWTPQEIDEVYVSAGKKGRERDQVALAWAVHTWTRFVRWRQATRVHLGRSRHWTAVRDPCESRR